MYKSSSIGQVRARLIQAAREILRSKIRKLINPIWNKEGLPRQLKSVIVPMYKKGDKADCSNYHCYQLHTKCYPITFSRLNPYIDEITGDRQCGLRRKHINCRSDFLHSSDTEEESGNKMRQYISNSSASRKHIINYEGSTFLYLLSLLKRMSSCGMWRCVDLALTDFSATVRFARRTSFHVVS
jgi:hypothetical protein